MNTAEAMKAPIHFSPRRLTHANLFVGELERSLAFYNRVCGLEIVMRQPEIGGGFLSNGNTHHDIGLIQATQKAVFGEGGHRILAEGQGSRPGLNHIGWEMESEFELTKAYRRALAAGYKIHRTVQHRASRSVYVFDADGHVHEFYADVDLDWRGRYRDGRTVSGGWTPGDGVPTLTPLYHEDPEIVRLEDAPVHPARITHAVMTVRNFDRMRDFFVHIAGLQEVFASAEQGLAAFQAPRTRSPYAIAILRGEGAPEGPERGLHHISFEVPDPRDLDAAEARLAGIGVRVERRCDLPHKQSIYIRDPDGLPVEFQHRRGRLDFASLAGAPDLGFLISSGPRGMRFTGEAMRRVEDRRFLTGRGRFVDDIALPGTVHAAFVRSPHAAADILGLDTARAAAMPGVLRILTGADWEAAGMGRFVVWSPVHTPGAPERPNMTQPILAGARVCYVGQPVALVVAETRVQALDAAEAVEVAYAPRTSITRTRDALAPDAPLVHPELGGNAIYSVEVGDRDATTRAFAAAAHVATLEVVNTRITANPMEPRALLGAWDEAEESYTLYVTHQAPHLLRRDLADNTLKHPEHRIRVVSPDVGGGFGMKMANHPEEPAILFAARLVGRPVRWTATRSEGLITDAQARDHATRARMAFDRQGRILALEAETIASLGAFQTRMGASIPAQFYARTLAGFYRLQAAHVRVTGVHTNCPPIQAYRGAGRPEAIYVLESLLEDGARALGVDPLEVRRRNFIASDQFPYVSALGLTYDSGNPAGLLDKALARFDYAAHRARQAQARAAGARELIGIGGACLIDCAGTPSKAMAGFGRKVIGGWDSAAIRILPDGRVTVFSGAHSHGQGHETAYAQIAADRLGLAPERIRVVEGDTDRGPFGHGSWGSRSTMTTGVAVAKAAEAIQAKCRRIAAHLLECDARDLDWRDMAFHVAGTDRALPFAEVVRAAYQGGGLPPGMEPGLEHLAFHDPVERACSSGFQICAVRVDTETGRVAIERYVAIDDCGTLINPMIVEGQTQGGLAQGIGQALMEHCVYDVESGQPLAGSFMDYAMPRSTDLPAFEIGSQETPSPNNPLGVKGAGESGTIGALAALRNAVMDALAPLGVRHIDMPLSAARVWAAIQAARAG